jgi:hypothetical protein
MSRFFGQNTVTGVSNKRSAITFRIKRSNKVYRGTRRLWSQSKINSKGKYTVTAEKSHFLIMKVNWNLCRTIKFVLPFFGVILNVRRSHKPPLFLPNATLKGEISWTLPTDLHFPNLYWGTVTISNFRHFMEKDKKNTFTLVPTDENNGRLVYWSLVFQLRILYSIVWYKNDVGCQ